MTSGRVSGRLNSSDPFHLVSSTSRQARANDSPANSTVVRRVTKKQEQLVLASLSETDRDLIDVLATVRMATGGQLQRLFWSDTASGQRLGRHHLAKLARQRVVVRIGRQVGGVRGGSRGHTYALDTMGQKIASADRPQRLRRPTTPSTPFVDHVLTVSETYVQLRELERHGDIALGGFAAEPAAWRPYVGPSGRRLVLKPDAFAEWHDADWSYSAFIEVDMATENPLRISTKGRQYLDYWQTGTEQADGGVFPLVLWVAPAERRAAVLRSALDLGADPNLFQVVTLDNFAGFVAAGSTGNRETG